MTAASTTAGPPVDLAGPPALGASPRPDGGCWFAVWAPDTASVTVHLDGPGARVIELSPGGGYHQGLIPGCPPGTRYRYSLDGGALLADPASRSQPDGVHGSSEVFDPRAHRWQDASFVAPPLWAHVLYELHVGTFTPQGTFDSAIAALDGLAELGITAVEPLPIAQFPGHRNWGYDGVFPCAVQSSYGGPAAFQRFVDACHQRGLAVVLDVVYNHLGPEGDILGSFGPYFTDRYRTPWGAAINFDGPGSDHVRRFFIDSALGWFADFHVDALRLDAVHGIVDPTARPFLAELATAAADLGATLGRPCLLIAESADNNPAIVSSQEAGGLGLDAQWNDDFHHALHAVLTGERFGYYQDFGRLDQLARAITDGFVYQGEYSPFRRRRHGAPTGNLAPARFVVFAQNHDHIGNRPRGDRLSTLLGFDGLRLAAAVLLLAPGIPLLFMGEEYGEPAPFPYFVDHGDPDLVEAVRNGRAEEFASDWPDTSLDPAAEETFQLAVLDHSLAVSGDHARLRALYVALIRLRRHHPTLTRPAARDVTAHAQGSVLVMVRGRGARAVTVLGNFLGTAAEDVVGTLPEPPAEGRWARLLDSADPALGGSGPWQPDEVEGSADLRLSPFGFCVYECRSPADQPASEQGS